jgi:cardiolipin synthase
LQSPSYKIIWIVLTAISPVIALILYIFVGSTSISKGFQRKIDIEYKDINEYNKVDESILKELKKIDNLKHNQIKYLINTTGLAPYRNEYIEYLNTSEKYFERMIESIYKATKYIFVQFFSIADGVMWDTLFEALNKKSQEGVKVYLITDSFGNMFKYPTSFRKKLVDANIKYRIFNKLSIDINKFLNYRCHRKIVVIDGEIAYTGGLNVGDEYINIYPKFGHWKDSGVKLLGKATLTYIFSFIKIWNLCSNDERLYYKDFFNFNIQTTYNKDEEGYIMPYFDGPDNTSNPARNLYMQIINNTKSNLYITTPYLILDNEMIGALINSVKSGVDIRIIVPHIPDKKIVNIFTKSFYGILLDAGIKIYEYSPGFIHSKILVSDNELATVGTINLNFRGMYSNYEFGNWIYKTGIEKAINDDFLETQNKSLEIKLDEWKKRGIANRTLDKFLMAIAPLI